MIRTDRRGGRSLPSQIAETIALKIFSGEYAPGSVLPNEHEWMRQFSVSRPVLREAVRLIAAKGMVASRPRLGTTVRDRADWTTLDADMLRWMQASLPVGEFVRHVMQIRMMIEPGAAALAAREASVAEIEQLTRLAAMIDDAAHSSLASQAADVAFHRLLLVASGNPLLAGLAACIEEALRATIALTRPADEKKTVDRFWGAAMQQHKEVVNRVRQRDANGAHAAMTALLETTAAHVRHLLEQIPQPEAAERV